MKYRTDFVTNSSSSSFLLAEGYDEEKFREHIRKKVKEFQVKAAEGSGKENGFWIREDYEGLAKWLEACAGEVMDIDELGKYALDEMLGWYEDEIIDPILQKAQQGEGELEEEEVKKIFQYVLLDLAFDIVDGRVGITAKLTEETVQNMVSRLTDGTFFFWNRWGEGVDGIVFAHYEEFLAYCEKIAEEGYTYSRLAKEFLGCSKAFYYDLETHYLVINAVEEFEDCRFSCNHMG